MSEKEFNTMSEAAGNGGGNGSDAPENPGFSIPNPANEEGNPSINNNIPSESNPTMAHDQMPPMGNYSGNANHQMNYGNNGMPWMSSNQFGGNQFCNNMPFNYGTNPFMNSPSVNFGLNNQASCVNPMGYMPNVYNPQLMGVGMGMGMGMPGTPQEMMAMHFAQQQQLLFQQQQQQQMMMYQHQQAAMLNSAAFHTPQQPSGTKKNRKDKKKNKNGKRHSKLKKSAAACCDSTSLSSKSDDSDDFDESKRKKHRTSLRLLVPQRKVNFRNPNVLLPSDDTHESGQETAPGPGDSIQDQTNYEEKARTYQREKKHIWQQLAEEEHLKETVDKMDVVTVLDKFVIERGCESYVVGNKRKRKITDNLDARVELLDDEFSSSYSSVSDGGLSDYSRDDVRRRLETFRASKKSKSTEKTDNDGNLSDATGLLDKEKVPKVKSGQQILEERMATFDPYKVPAYMARRLQENKVELFIRVWRIFGMEYILSLFRKTLKIERLGGLLIKNKQRRRTPGGVFLYLLRNDERLDKESRLEVFRPMQEEIQTARKQNKVLQKKNLFAGIAKRMNHSHTDVEETEKPVNEGEGEQLLGFEDESYVVAVPDEKIEIPGIEVAEKIGTESTEMEVVNSTTPVVEIQHPQPLISYDDLCVTDYLSEGTGNGCWKVDLTPLGY